ncbi:MAG: AbrB family transcriptional regulator [Paracoccaceae bacterium]
MTPAPTCNTIRTNIITLLVGAIGATLGYALSFPVFILTGPAILVMLLSLIGMKFCIAPPLQDAALLLIGIAIGASVDTQAAQVFLRWPVAFALLGVMLFCILYSSHMLSWLFGYDRHTAVLASTPGHMAFVMTMGVSLNLNVAQVAVVQAVRLFALNMLVPFTALAFGLQLNALPVQTTPTLSLLHLAVLLIAGVTLGLLFKRLNTPAPLLMGGLLVSTLAHISNLTPGPLNPSIAIPAFLVIGTLSGARFSGISLALLKSSLAAGVVVTAIAATWSLLAAYLVAQYLGMPLIHVMVAFAPGGLGTMVALGAVIGANPGFVAAIHVARLLMLIVLVPMMLSPHKPPNSP